MPRGIRATSPTNNKPKINRQRRRSGAKSSTRRRPKSVSSRLYDPKRYTSLRTPNLLSVRAVDTTDTLSLTNKEQMQILRRLIREDRKNVRRKKIARQRAKQRRRKEYNLRHNIQPHYRTIPQEQETADTTGSTRRNRAQRRRRRAPTPGPRSRISGNPYAASLRRGNLEQKAWDRKQRGN